MAGGLTFFETAGTLQKVLDGLPAAVYTCNTEGLITYFNAQAVELWGHEPKLNDPAERYCGSYGLVAVDGSPVKPENSWMARALRNEQDYLGKEILVLRPDGKRIAAMAHVNVIHDHAGRLLGAVNLLVDVTARNQAEARLRKKDALLAMIHKASLSLTADLTPKEVMQTIVDSAVEVADAEFGVFGFRSQASSEDLYALSGISREEARVHPAFSMFNIADHRSIIRLDDLSRHPAVSQIGTDPSAPGLRPVRSFLMIPIMARTGGIAGQLIVGHSQAGRFSGLAELMIGIVASHAATVIENAELLEQARRHADTLEQRVAQRTADLNLLNRELESFNYSVSHDLRAPLRSIEGFSQILQEDHGETLDAAGRQHLERIRNATQRMSDLIDSMLSLSRVSRAPLKIEKVDVGKLACRVIEGLRDSEPDRHVKVEIMEGLAAEADEVLLGTVLENLLNNAWKFTRNQPLAHISVKAETRDQQTVFVVSDNGAGFDMRYSDKLFTAFQRLHPPDSFAGSGIGLATVQRIISNHSGRVWAKGKPGAGATFYFTLEPSAQPDDSA